MSDLEALIQRYVDCYNRMEIDDMMECVSDSVTFENFSNAGQSMQMNGKDALRQVAEASANAFKYRRQSIINLICSQEGQAAAEIHFQGIAALNLPNGTKEGQSIDIRGVSIFEAEVNLLTRIAEYS